MKHPTAAPFIPNVMRRRLQRYAVLLVLALLLGGCGREAECAGLENLCRDRCSGDVRAHCLRTVEQADEKLCRASYSGFARWCPDFDALFD